MGGIGLPELFFIGVIALLVFGPDKLPELARTLGKTLGELRKASDAVRREFYQATYQNENSTNTNSGPRNLVTSESGSNLANGANGNNATEQTAGDQAPESDPYADFPCPEDALAKALGKLNENQDQSAVTTSTPVTDEKKAEVQAAPDKDQEA